MQPTSLTSYSAKAIEPASTIRNKADLLYVYPPDKQVELCGDIQECIEGEHPSLAVVSSRFGKSASAAWIVQHLFNLSEFCGCKGKLSKSMLNELGFIIANEFYYLKVTELMLFIYRFKLGDYGKFFGSVDPMVILSSLRQFVYWRNTQIDHFDAERKLRQREEWAKTSISREEYDKRIKSKENEKPKD